VSCHCSLADALPGPDHRDRGELERLQARRVEAEVGAYVRQPGGERTGRPAKSLRRPEHRLVREVDDDVCPVEALDERHPIVASLSQLLGATDHDRADELVRQRGERITHHRRVVLAVDEGNGTRHRLAVTSRSIRPVYFSYSPVARSNWMIRSWPWKG